jgi:hypothetical protein
METKALVEILETPIKTTGSSKAMGKGGFI